MRLTVGELRRLLAGTDSETEVHIAVDGFESAPLLAEVEKSDDVLFFRLSPASEVFEVLSEADILR